MAKVHRRHGEIMLFVFQVNGTLLLVFNVLYHVQLYENLYKCTLPSSAVLIIVQLSSTGDPPYAHSPVHAQHSAFIQVVPL